MRYLVWPLIIAALCFYTYARDHIGEWFPSKPSVVRPRAISTGDTATVVLAAVGCRSSKDESRLFELLNAKDTEAAMAFVRDRTGLCIEIGRGTSVTVEDRDVWADQLCVR